MMMVKTMADKEKLSALMDGEMIDTALLAELSRDQESLQTWKNYHVIGDVMRGDAPAMPEWNIAERVALALENEPAHTRHSAHALNPGQSDDLTHMDRVVPMDVARLEEQPAPSTMVPSESRVRRHLPNWLNQFGQVAIAACVSLAVIVGVQQYGGSDDNAAQNGQVPVLQTVPFAGSAEPVSLTRDSFEKSHANELQAQEQRRRVNAMLQDYELQLRLNSNDSALYNDRVESEVE